MKRLGSLREKLSCDYLSNGRLTHDVGVWIGYVVEVEAVDTGRRTASGAHGRVHEKRGIEAEVGSDGCWETDFVHKTWGRGFWEGYEVEVEVMGNVKGEMTSSTMLERAL